MNDLDNCPALSACPFCGGSAAFKYSSDPMSAEEAERMSAACKTKYSPGHLFYGCWISCEECPADFGFLGTVGTQEMDGGHFDTFSEAAEAWNTRK